MRRGVVAVVSALSFGIVASPAAARVVNVEYRDYDVAETVDVLVKPNRAARPGWHYRVFVTLDNEDEDGLGCSQFAYRSSHFGRRAFTVSFTPQSAVIPDSGADEWCTGRAMASLYEQRNGTRSLRRGNARRVAGSRWFYFSNGG